MCSRLAAVRDVASGGEQWRSLHQEEEEEEERRHSYIQESEELDQERDGLEGRSLSLGTGECLL